MEKVTNKGISKVLGYIQELAKNAIHHSHRDHNVPCFNPPPPQKKKKKKFTLVLFLTSWDNCDTQEKLATMVMPIFFWGGGAGAGGGKQGALWSMWRWWIQKLRSFECMHMYTPCMC